MHTFAAVLQEPAKLAQDMRPSEFIVKNMEAILREWDAFACTYIPGVAKMTPEAVRDLARKILTAVAKDLLPSQSKRPQIEKSKGLALEII